MNSSTSSSDPTSASFLKVFFGLVVGLLPLMLAVLVLVDPYGTGRLTPFASRHVPETGPRMANANRLADPAFNAAIIGNSTIQLLNPERLTGATGLNFVQLSIPGTGPQEQTAVVQRLFATRGGAMKTLVIGLEGQWCNVAMETKTANPFPFWLYSLSDIQYAIGLFRSDVLEFLPKRIGLKLGKEKKGRADGFWDYEPLAGHRPDLLDSAKFPTIAGPIGGRNAATPFLKRLLDAAPPETRIILVHPPVFVQTPPSETASDRRNLAQCKAEIASVALARPNTQIRDFWVDNDLTRNKALFLDPTHYRTDMAKNIEAEVVKALGSRSQ